MKRKQIPERRLVPFEVIEAAMQGDHAAIAVVLDHFSGYIKTLSTRVVYDDDGVIHEFVDENLRALIESTLAEKIPEKFKLRK